MQRHRVLWGHEEHSAKLVYMSIHQEESGLQNSQKKNNYSSRVKFIVREIILNLEKYSKKVKVTEWELVARQRKVKL